MTYCLILPMINTYTLTQIAGMEWVTPSAIKYRVKRWDYIPIRIDTYRSKVNKNRKYMVKYIIVSDFLNFSTKK